MFTVSLIINFNVWYKLNSDHCFVLVYGIWCMVYGVLCMVDPINVGLGESNSMLDESLLK